MKVNTRTLYLQTYENMANIIQNQMKKWGETSVLL